MFGHTTLQSNQAALTFLALDNDLAGVEQGYNTASSITTEFASTTVSKTLLPFSSIPRIEIGGVIYRELTLDISEPGVGGAGEMALNDLRLYASDANNLSGYNTTNHTLGGVTPFYDMDATADNTILVYGQGTGKADLIVYIPETSFFIAPNTPPAYVYLYSKLGDYTVLDPIQYPNRADYAAAGGNEDWAVGLGGPVTALADLSVTKTDGLTYVTPGQTVSYNITVTNNGPTTVNGIQLDDTLPTQFLPGVPFTPSTGNYNPTTGQWTNLTLAAGQQLSMTVRGTISPSATPGQMTNTVHVSPLGLIGDSNLTNYTATDIDTIVSPAIHVVKTANVGSVPETGGGVTYTYQVTNASLAGALDPLHGVTLTDTDGTPTFVSGDANSNGLLDVGETWTYTLAATVPPGDAALTSHTNTATATGIDDEGVTASGSASATVNYANVNPAISVVKTASVSSVPETGGSVTYT